MRMNEFLNKPFSCEFDQLGGFEDGKFIITRPSCRGAADFLILVCGSCGCDNLNELNDLIETMFFSVTRKRVIVECESNSGFGLNGVRIARAYLVKNSIISINDIKKWQDIETCSYDDLDVPF